MIAQIKKLVRQKKYRVRIHAVRHMIEEGFDENNVIAAIEDGKVLEDYFDDKRCLLLGYFNLFPKVKLPLHIVCDYSEKELVDIVTAYIPQKPWWETPTRRGKV